MWFFETSVTHLLGRRCWVSITKIWYTFSHISGCKIVHLCTIATVTVYICTITVALLFIILMLYSHSVKTTIFTLFLSPLTEQHPRRAACFSLFHSSHLLSSSGSFQLLLIVIITGNYVIDLGFLQHHEDGESIWRYLYQALGNFL